MRSIGPILNQMNFFVCCGETELLVLDVFADAAIVYHRAVSGGRSFCRILFLLFFFLSI